LEGAWFTTAVPAPGAAFATVNPAEPTRTEAAAAIIDAGLKKAVIRKCLRSQLYVLETRQ
jgi:hypothetical protein